VKVNLEVKRNLTENIIEWKRNEQTRLDEERERTLREKGINPFYRLETGENPFTLLPEIPINSQGKYGEQRVFAIEKSGKKYSLAVSPKSKLYRILISKLNDKPIEINIVRTGIGKETQYSLKE
jgi:hypothetical protein